MTIRAFAAVAIAATLAGATGASALAPIKHFDNARVGIRGPFNAQTTAKVFCSNKGYKNLYHYSFDHIETLPAGGYYPPRKVAVYTTIQCTNANVG